MSVYTAIFINAGILYLHYTVIGRFLLVQNGGA